MKKLNNKGFSLVELIIVIAIMVILVAVLAPQFTKWVERSRVGTDIQNASEIATAVQVAYAEGKVSAGVTGQTIDLTKLTSMTAEPKVKSNTVKGAGSGDAFTYDISATGAVTVYGSGVKLFPEPATAIQTYLDS